MQYGRFFDVWRVCREQNLIYLFAKRLKGALLLLRNIIVCYLNILNCNSLDQILKFDIRTTRWEKHRAPADTKGRVQNNTPWYRPNKSHSSSYYCNIQYDSVLPCCTRQQHFICENEDVIKNIYSSDFLKYWNTVKKISRFKKLVHRHKTKPLHLFNISCSARHWRHGGQVAAGTADRFFY